MRRDACWKSEGGKGAQTDPHRTHHMFVHMKHRYGALLLNVLIATNEIIQLLGTASLVHWSFRFEHTPPGIINLNVLVIHFDPFSAIDCSTVGIRRPNVYLDATRHVYIPPSAEHDFHLK